MSAAPPSADLIGRVDEVSAAAAAFDESWAGIDDVVQRQVPVGLDELVARAARLTRVDRKYLVPAEEAAALLHDLGARTRVLQVEGERRFPYVSVYHDTLDLHCYRSAAQRRRRRFKVRQRCYLDSGDTFVEVKTRGARRATVKQRAASRRLGVLDAADRGFVRDVLGSQGIDASVRELRPVLTTQYVRTTLLLPEDAARLTLDTGLTWTAPDGALARTRLVVVETKGGASASVADRLLRQRGHRPVRLSKFGTGLALLDDDLPAHKWHRTVRRLSEPAPPPLRLSAVRPLLSPDGIPS